MNNNNFQNGIYHKVKLSILLIFMAYLGSINNSNAADATSKTSTVGEVCIDILAGVGTDYHCATPSFNAVTANSLNTTGTGQTSVGNNFDSTTITGGTNNLNSSDPALIISGQNGSTAPLTATGSYPAIPVGTGVLITGAGQGGGSDVYIASQNGEAAISVTNLGVRIISPAGTGTGPGQTINVTTNNTYGNAGMYNSGSVTNSFGNGNSTASGLITNNIGSAAAGGGTVNNSVGGGTGNSNNNFGVNTASGASSTNNLGTAVAGSTATNTLGGGAGTTTNSVGNASGSGSATNSFGNATSGATSTNTIGGGTGVTTNNMGNINVNTTIGLTAGNATQNLANGVSTTSVQAGGGVGASAIPGAGGTTSANTGVVLSGASGTYATVNSNGQLSMVTGLATQSSTSMTITNGLGNVHGLVVNELQATLSGGQNSSSMTLNDNGATFSNPANGAPVQVHGVADGTSSHDAVNVRQLGKGVAMASALAGMPQVDPGKRFNLSMGVGNHMSESAMAIGASARINENIVVKAGGSFAGGGNATANAGVGISF